jgi:hypothetical protein
MRIVGMHVQAGAGIALTPADAMANEARRRFWAGNHRRGKQ